MALMITIPKADLAKSIPLPEGWAEFEIVAAYAKPSKAGDSINYWASHKLVGDLNEREIDHCFSSKALGIMNTWLAALAGKTIQEVLDGITSGALTFDFESTIGKHVMGKVKQEPFEGRIISKIIDYATVGKVPF